MSIYSNNKKLIMDYVNGNDTSVDVDILENDLDFMIAAINYSGDANLYKLCGSEIEYDYEMIKFLVEKFHDNHEFIIETVLKFLNNCDYANWYKEYMGKKYIDDDVEELEVLITIDKYLPKELDPRILEIKMRLKFVFTLFTIDLETIKLKYPNSEVAALAGNGFEIIELLYPTSYIVKDYFAKSFLDEIFKEENGSFEEKVHKIYGKCHRPEGAINLLVDLVKRSDMELANYILVRQDVFKNYLRRISDIISNWETFETQLLDSRIYNILDVIHDYYFEHGHLLVMDETDAIKYFANTLGLTDRFKELDPITYEIDQDNERIAADKFNDQKMVKDLLPVINDIINGNNTYDAYEVAESSKARNGSVVDFTKKSEKHRLGKM